MRAQLDLNGLGDDIYHLICSHLLQTSPSTLPALARVSRAVNGIAIQYLYRNLVLSRGENSLQKRNAYLALLSQFRQGSDTKVAKYVRHIRVEDLVPTEELLVFLDKVHQLGNFRRFSWNVTGKIPAPVLHKLQACRPDLRISVYSHDRHRAAEDRRRIDTELLSSPMLDNLVYTVYVDGWGSNATAKSEWPKLTRALVSGASCKSLRLQIRPDGYNWGEGKVLDESTEEGMLRFDVGSNTQLPVLEELCISTMGYGPTYQWDIRHCIDLQRCMDWTRMRKLDFSSDYPEPFFATSVGLTPGLRHLRFGLPYQSQSVEPARAFVESLVDMKSLDIERMQPYVDVMWPAIRKHKDTLETLLLRPTRGMYCTPQYLDTSILLEISREFPALERLGYDVPFMDTHGPKKAKIDDEHLLILLSINVKRLDFFLHLPRSETDFSDRLTQNAMGTIPAPKINIKGSKKAAIVIADNISEIQRRSLQTLTLHFARTGEQDRAQPYLMIAKMQLRRSNRDDAEHLGDEKYRFILKCDWAGHIQTQDEMVFEEDVM